jgi:predicted kinase
MLWNDRAVASDRRPPTLILVRGAPGGGKSTIARHILASWRERDARPLLYLSTDGISREITGGRFVAEIRPTIYESILLMAGEFMKLGMDTILDGNFVKDSQRQPVRDLAVKHEALFLDVLVHCDLESRLSRN